jgi:hypothetical protein
VNNQILATRLLIASTGAMLIVGHEAPCRMSALACRIESRDHSGKEGNSRQVSGTSDASKTQLRLIGSQSEVVVKLGSARKGCKNPSYDQRSVMPIDSTMRNRRDRSWVILPPP